MWQPEFTITTDERYVPLLRAAYDYGWTNSNDPKTRVGAVIVAPDLTTILAYGANQFPPDVHPTKEQLGDRAWKYAHIVDAEKTAINNAHGAKKQTEGAIMVMPWTPCESCAEAIIAAGIVKLVGHETFIISTHPKWQEERSRALTLLKGAGIERLMYRGKIGNVKAYEDYREWEP
ncbi:hypothetical protein C4573_01470 [Candidatus Woesearchaeota archaeon]|nr:MAG: hypothetical protein C4573_01470 [Candidatus Woesearchaeota archaeon]